MAEKIQCTFHLCKLRVMDCEQRRELSARTVARTILDFYNNHTPVDRIRGEGASEHNNRQLLGRVSMKDGILTGITFDWEKDAHVQTIHIPQQGNEIRFDDIGAHKQEGDKFAEIVRSSAAFALKGAYIAYCGKNARKNLLQEVFTYVLTASLNRTIAVDFDPLPANHLTDDILNKISKMRITHRIDTEESCQSRENTTSRYRYTPKTKQFFAGILGDTNRKFSEDISGDLEMSISINVKNKHHLSGDSRRIVGELARMFIDMPNAKIWLDDNNYLTKDDMQISKIMQVASINRIPIYNALLIQLSQWLANNLPRNADV